MISVIFAANATLFVQRRDEPVSTGSKDVNILDAGLHLKCNTFCCEARMQNRISEKKALESPDTPAVLNLTRDEMTYLVLETSFSTTRLTLLYC